MSPTRCLIVCLSLLAASPAAARTWTDLDQAVKGPPAAAALALVQARLQQFEAPAGATVRVARVIPVRDGAVVRIQRTVNGQPVLNSNLSLLILRDHVVAASGTLGGVASGSTDALNDPRPALKRLGQLIPGAVVSATRTGYFRTGGQLVPAVSAQLRRGIHAFRVVLHARTHQVLSSAPAMVEASGKAYVMNPKVGTLSTVELKGVTTAGQLTGEFVDAQSCGASSTGTVTCKRHAIPDATSGDYLHDPEEPSFTDPFSEVQAYYHVDSFHRWMKDTFGFARVGDQQIKVMVNFNFETTGGNTEGLYNAFFGDVDDDGKGELVFGQGTRDFAYDADVIYHEFTHSVVEETSNLTASLDALGFNMTPLSINEAFADLFSSIRAGDSKVGEYAGGNNPIRDLLGSATCPDNLSGESHRDGLLWGRACWAMREQAQDKAAFDDALYKTMVALDPGAGFDDAAALFIKVATLADASLAALAQSELTARGLTDCTRIVPLAEGDKRRAYIMGIASLQPLQVVPAPFQYRIDVPATATSLIVNVGSSWGGSSTASIGAYLRKNSPVSYAGTKPTYDFVLANGQGGSILLATTDPKNKLEPGSTYYVLPLNVGANDTRYQVTMALTLEQPPEPDGAVVTPDAGAPTLDSAPINPVDPDEVATGCSCTLAGEPAPTGLFALLLLGLALALRFRSRRRD